MESGIGNKFSVGGIDDMTLWLPQKITIWAKYKSDWFYMITGATTEANNPNGWIPWNHKSKHEDQQQHEQQQQQQQHDQQQQAAHMPVPDCTDLV